MTTNQINFAKSALAQLESLGLVEQFVKSFEAGENVATEMAVTGAVQAQRKFERMQVQLMTRPDARKQFIDAIYDKLAAA